MEYKEVCPEYKITLVGESGVGKTCIIKRFIENKFDKSVTTNMTATYFTKKIEYEELENLQVELNIWDTAGEEVFRSLTKIFYKDTDAAILVYDCTDKHSFEEMKDYWYEQIKEKAPESIVLAIAAGKCDLTETEEVNEEEAKAFAQEIGAIFKVTSAANNIGIDELFHDLGFKLLTLGHNFNEPKKQLTKKDIEEIKISLTRKSINKPDNNVFVLKKDKEESCFKKFMNKYC